MREIDNLKKAILEEYPRLSEDSRFKFNCHKGISCFNKCCGDVNIFLTPYDILRLKNNLSISSEQFLKKYTITPFDKNLKYPVLLLKMEDDDKKSCPFVTEEGCGVYPDRPWSCRMYPLGLASPKEDSKAADKEFFFLLKEEGCMGFEEDRDFTVREWLIDQEIKIYNEMGEYFKNLTLHKFFLQGNNLTPEKLEMFFMVCYNIEKFKKFVFQSSFFDKFDVDKETREKIKKDEVELQKFGYRWLRFALFGEDSMTVKKHVLETKKKELEQQKKPTG